MSYESKWRVISKKIFYIKVSVEPIQIKCTQEDYDDVVTLLLDYVPKCEYHLHHKPLNSILLALHLNTLSQKSAWLTVKKDKYNTKTLLVLLFSELKAPCKLFQKSNNILSPSFRLSLGNRTCISAFHIHLHEVKEEVQNVAVPIFQLKVLIWAFCKIQHTKPFKLLILMFLLFFHSHMHNIINVGNFCNIHYLQIEEFKQVML